MNALNKAPLVTIPGRGRTSILPQDIVVYDHRDALAIIQQSNGHHLIDKSGYELLREKAQADLQSATQALDLIQTVEPVVDLPPLETVLAARARDGGRRGGVGGR